MSVDPFTLATGISGLLGAAFNLAKSIFTVIDAIKDTPKHIKAVSSDTKSIFAVLGTLSGYLNEEDTAAGVIHYLIAADLKEVLNNSIAVLKEMQLIVYEFYKEEQNTANIAMWKRLKWDFRSSEIEKWCNQLGAHKITLSVTIAMANLVNTNVVARSTRRIEDEVIELKTAVTQLLMRLETAEDQRADQDIVIDNYNQTMRQVARGADSIISEAPWDRPPSPSFAMSSLKLSYQTGSSGENPRSLSTKRYSSSRGTASFLTAPESKVASTVQSFEICRTHAETTNTRISIEKGSIPAETTSVKDSGDRGPVQLFIKGPYERTNVMRFEIPPTVHEICTEIQRREGVPQDRLSLRCHGVVLHHDRSTPLRVTHGMTLHACINAKSWVDQIQLKEEIISRISRELFLYYSALFADGSMSQFRPKRGLLMLRKRGPYDSRAPLTASTRRSLGWFFLQEEENQRTYFAILDNWVRRGLSKASNK